LEVEFSEPRQLGPEDFIVPPDWAVRLVSTNAGKRGQKYPSSWIGYRSSSYPGAGPDVDWYGLDGMGDHSGAYSESWRRMDEEAKAREDKTANFPIKGNLKEEQYRFWNGSASTSTNIATCRWCRHWAYGPDAMQSHQSKTDHSRILREIYDFARKQRTPMCFTCGAKTTKEHWGIPMWKKNRCRNKWRVAVITEIGLTLLLYAKFARKKGLLNDWIKEDGSEKANFEAIPKPFNWSSSSSY
jgi:hypothetical protein